MSEAIIVGLEIGTSRVRAAAASVLEDGSLNVIGTGASESLGVRKGEVVDNTQAAESVDDALEQVEASSDVDIHEICLALSGAHMAADLHRGRLPLESGYVEEEDRAKVARLARSTNLPEERQTLHTFPQLFVLDGRDGISDPVGMEGDMLELDVLTVHGEVNRMRNMSNLAQGTGVDVAGVAFSGLCSALAVLSPEEKQNGVAVVDLGGGKTDFLVYVPGYIAAAGSLAVGGDHVTNDVAQGFRLSTSDAERLKVEYGSAVMDIPSRTQKVPVPRGDLAGAGRMIRLGDLQTIIEMRVEETFQLIKDQWVRKKLLDRLAGGVVLTGGGANMKKIVSCAERIFSLPCRVGAPVGFSGRADLVNVPEWATVTGLLRFAASKQMYDAPRTALVERAWHWLARRWSRKGAPT